MRIGNLSRIDSRNVGASIALGLALAIMLAGTAQAQEACNIIGECYTADEYTEAFSVDGLVASGVFTNPVDNGDGTVTLFNTSTGVDVIVEADPLARPVAATPSLEPDAPTIGEVLFGLYPATAQRLAALEG